MKNSRCTYLRFVLKRTNSASGVADGIFSATYELRNNPATPAHDHQRLEELVDWFGKHLGEPEKFNRTTSKGYYRRETKGISWFKETSEEHLAKIRELASILAENGVVVEQIRTEKPGYIIYEDEFQIVAEPFADSIRK